jgi:pyruvate/2-oxoglutarate dehydrogenase complex dihydrolipoamide dehydrogenase (E3) component
MPFHYDLVIIGGTFAARDAALFARSFGARVALVEPEPSNHLGLTEEVWLNYAIAKIAHTAHQMRQVEQFGWQVASAAKGDRPSFTVNWAEAMAWAKTAIANLEAERSQAVLAANGIDVVLGQGQFASKEQVLVVGDRHLQSRKYLIAVGSHSALPAIEGLSTVHPLTPERLYQSDTVQSPPPRLIVIGAEPIAVELAQTFARLGSQVTLAVGGDRLLPCEDAEAAWLIQAQLEAEGIQVLTQVPITQIRQLGDQKWAQIGTRAIEADEILLADRAEANLTTLNLESAGVLHKRDGIAVNRKLQTANPHIYACGVAIGGYPFEHIARYEARIAVKNALFFPIHSVHYQAIPWAILMEPALARVGMTEFQAKRRYGDAVVVLRQSFKALAKANLSNETTGFCKLIVRTNGEILGAHLVGAETEEVVGAIALLMQNRIKITNLAQLPAISLTSSEILQQTAEQWRHYHLKRNTYGKNWRSRWFNLRRG